MTERGRSDPQPGRGPQTPCPSSETLAAYLDGTLSNDERMLVESHVADCAECRELMVETVRFQQADATPVAKIVPFRRRLVMATGALLAAATVLLAVRVGAPLWWERNVRGNPRPELAELVAAVGESRPVEARLSGGFAFGPLASGTRSGASSGPEPSPAVRIAAARIEERAIAQNTPADVAALGVAALTLGDVERAVGLLEEAAMNAPDDARIHSDLSAAYLARSESGRPEDLPRALTAAQMAVELSRTALVEAWFNRALALERLRLRREADRAWEDYLRRDSTSPWAEEARRYLAGGGPGASLLGPASEALAALTAGDDAGMARVVAAFPQETRERVENTLLPAWAEAVRAGDDSDTPLMLAEALARHLASTTRDTLALDATSSVRRTGRSSERARRLAAGHQAYREALRYFSRFELEPAREAFSNARAAFVAEQSPFRYWSDLHLAILADYRREYEAALRQLDDLLRDSPSSYRTLRARALWIRGLVRAEIAQFAGALEDDLAARAIYVEIGEGGNASWMDSLIAELFRQLGESNLAWRYRTEALGRLDPRAFSRNRQSLLINASRSARDEGLLPASVYFDAEAAVIARQDVPAACAQVEVRRIATLRELGRHEDVRAVIESAKTCLAKVDDPSLSARLGAELLAEEGLALAATNGEDAVEHLTRAIEYSEGVAELLNLPRLYLERGRLYRKLGRTELAIRDFNAGIEQFERYRAEPGVDALRISYFDESWRLFDELIAMHAVERTDGDAALAAAERRRRDESYVVPVDRFMARHVPDGVAVIYFASLPDRLLTWVLTAGSVHFADRPTPSTRLDQLVIQLQQARDQGAAERERNVAGDAYDELIRPLAPHVPDGARLAIVADGPLHRLPFAQLYDRSRQAYLIEQHAITLAPSLAERTAAPRVNPASRALIVTPPARLSPDLASLTHAVEEGRTIARGYAEATMLDGAAATLDAVVAAMPRHDIMHFAGHAIANPDYPALSRLLLAPSTPEGTAAILTSAQVSRLDLSRTSLVVLAACSTAAGRISRGQGALGLARAFLDGGAHSVVATLWDINDQASRALFTAFHDRLRVSGDVAMALRDAQLALLTSPDPELRQPTAWAGVVHQGRIDSH